MFEPDTPDEPGWSDNIGQPDAPEAPEAPEAPQDQSDETDGGLFNLDLSTALYWSGAVGITSTILLLLINTITRHVRGAVCIGETYNNHCSFANVAINDLFFIIMSVYAVTAVLWIARDKPRDAHPWIVTVFGFFGGFAGILAANFLTPQLAAALHVGQVPLTVTVIGLLTAGFIALSTWIKPKRRTQRWRQVAIALLPYIILCRIGVTLRTDHEIRGNFTDAVSYRVEQVISEAEQAAERFPERQRHLLATEWLDQPYSLFSEDESNALEDHIGEIDAVGHGRDFRLVVEHVLEEAARREQPADEWAASAAQEGLLQNVHIIGRRGSGYCLVEISVKIDEEKPFELHGSFSIPRTAMRIRPLYCVVDDLLFSFDDAEAGDKAARLAGKLSCPPSTPPHPYAASAAERDTAARLQAGVTKSDIDEGACPRPTARDSIRIYRTGPPTFGRAFEGLDAQTTWATKVADKLGLAPSQPRDDSFEELFDLERAEYIRRAIRRAQRGPSVPGLNALEPIFGRIRDGFSTARLNHIVDEVVSQTERRGGIASLEKLAEGIDVARFIVGETRSGWCVYRLRAKPAPGRGDDIIRADLDHQLRYCLAGTRLHAFDSAGEVERSWDATGLRRRAPLFDPSDTTQFVGEDREAFEKRGDRVARDGLIKQFLDGLVSGELDDVSQLETISMARGADLLEPSTKEAMRRMLAQSSDSDETSNQ